MGRAASAGMLMALGSWSTTSGWTSRIFLWEREMTREMGASMREALGEVGGESLVVEVVDVKESTVPFELELTEEVRTAA